MNRKFIFVALIILTLLFLFFAYLFLSAIKPAQNPTTQNSTGDTVASSGEIQAIVPLVHYQLGSMTKAERLAETRQKLSQSDDAKKSSMIVLANADGIVYSNQNFQVEYFSPLDIFQVQILTTDIAGAKQDALTWFAQKGFTSDAICNLPVIFFLNHDVALQLAGTNTVFNPLPDNCK